MYQLTFYVPQSHLDIVKEAIFATGAGKIGDYSKCCWQTEGEGQYMPLPGSTPFEGEVNQIAKIKEFKVELVCADEMIEAAIKALLDAHPYEEPAYQVIKLMEF